MTMNYTFDPLKDDGSPRKCAGMWRPLFPDWVKEAHPYSLWYHMREHREQWLMGAGDRPLYEA